MRINKIKLFTLIIAITAIINFTFFKIVQIEDNYQANLSNAKECIKSGGTLVITNENFNKLSQVHCE